MELITVTVIITLLSAISYTSYRGYHQRARGYQAKRDLSSIVAIAEVFRSNAGFYLPNLKEMHVPIKGRHSYNYKVLCHDSSGSAVEWGRGSDVSGTCGQFAYSAHGAPTLPSEPAENTLDASLCEGPYGANQCWMGYVLCHSSPPNNEFLPKTDAFPCPADPGSSGPYKNKKDYYPSVIQFKSASDTDWNAGAATILGDDCTGNKGLACYFTPVDFTSKRLAADTPTPPNPPRFSAGDPLCERKSRQDDLLRESGHCFFNKEFAVKSEDVKTVLTSTSEWGSDQKSFISNPSKLVITALACKERQDDCGQGNGPYSIIRMDTNRMVKEIE